MLVGRVNIIVEQTEAIVQRTSGNEQFVGIEMFEVRKIDPFVGKELPSVDSITDPVELTYLYCLADIVEGGGLLGACGYSDFILDGESRIVGIDIHLLPPVFPIVVLRRISQPDLYFHR